MRTRVSLILVAGAASGAAAQTNIDPVLKFSWQENCGWMNWADAHGGAQGARDNGTYFSGYIWGENIGWISLGSGTPLNGIQFANTDHTNYGVNIASGGALSGMAWGENIGWINFGGGALASPPQPARLDLAAGRLRGYAWGENIGWVNLDDATKYVKRICYANCDQSTIAPVLNVLDFNCFLNRFASGDPTANCDRSTVAPVLNVLDFNCFLNRFAAGCP